MPAAGTQTRRRAVFGAGGELERRLYVRAMAVGGILGLAMAANSGAAAGEPTNPKVFEATASVSSVLVPVTVTRLQGTARADPRSEEVPPLVDGIEFPIRSFWREGGLPLSFTFLLDTSGSMGRGASARPARPSWRWSSSCAKQDEVCLITFGAAEVKRRLPFRVDPW